MMRIRILVACGLATLAIGCGSETASVSGRVVFAKPPAKVEEVTVILVGPNGQPVTALVGPDGTYAAHGVGIGEVRVGLACQPAAYVAAVESFSESAEEPGRSKSARRKPARRPTGPPSLERYPNPVPATYWDPLKSPVRLTTQAGDNSFDIHVAN